MFFLLPKIIKILKYVHDPTLNLKDVRDQTLNLKYVRDPTLGAQPSSAKGGHEPLLFETNNKLKSLIFNEGLSVESNKSSL